MAGTSDDSERGRSVTTESVAKAVRRQARQEIKDRILEAARARLGHDGPSALSLRAVARDVGMASSAVYRYVPSRDDLLTELIVQSYDALGRAAEEAEGAVARDDLPGRWLAICHAVRNWALANPNEYALIYGSPVPGYAAPEETVGPATRVTGLLSGLLADGSTDPTASGTDGASSDPLLHRSLIPVRSWVPHEVSDDVLIGGLMAWTHLFGAISFELFGHRHRVVADEPELRHAFFEEECRRIGALAGIVAPAADG